MVDEIKLHKEQWKAYNFKTPYGAAICGTKGGKSFVGAVWAQKKIQEFPTGVGLIAAPTNKILQQATLDSFFNLFPEYRAFYKKQESTIELPEGGKVYIRSTDDPLAVEGLNLNWAWLDEAGMMARLVWQIVKNKVAVYEGQVFLTTNAYYLNWLYKEVFLPFKDGTDQEISVFNWRSIDNPYFPKAFADKERERMSPQEFSRRYEGKFERLEGLVWDLDKSSILELTSDLEEYLEFPDKVLGGIDWGYSNPSGVLVCKVKDDKYYITSEWKQPKKTTSDIIEKVITLNNENRVQVWYPDPAEPDRLEELRRAGIPIGDVNKSITMGIAKVGELFKSHRLFILNTCVELIDEISQYRYENPKDNSNFKELPVKVNDHLCDSLRYLVIGNELGQNYSYQEEQDVARRILENRNLKRNFELL